jgi:hypothetical protein
LGGRGIQISEAKRCPPPKKKKLRTQINGKFNDISSAYENKKISVEHLFKNYKKTVHSFIDRRLRNCTCFLM